MLNNAITKIEDEMSKNKNNGYIQAVGGFLLGRLKTNQADAEKILADDKTIAKSLDKMRDEAKKKQVGNCAVLTDEEGFAVVLKYFGIDAAVPVKAKPAASSSFDINLEDLL